MKLKLASYIIASMLYGGCGCDPSMDITGVSNTENEHVSVPNNNGTVVIGEGNIVNNYMDGKLVSSYKQTNYSSSSITSAQHTSVFPTDLSYIGIYKTSSGANLVMKNNTAYSMSVNVNYTVSCSINGKPAQTTTKTLHFTFDMYEQKEHDNSVDGYYHGGMDTIECTGTITSIIPTPYDDSNFQAWTGSYPISTK